MDFANDGGIYRALNGFTGLTTGSCSGTNQFYDLNQNLGSMTQFVGFSQHAINPKIFLRGTQDNGSPATSTATTSKTWRREQRWYRWRRGRPAKGTQPGSYTMTVIGISGTLSHQSVTVALIVNQ